MGLYTNIDDVQLRKFDKLYKYKLSKPVTLFNEYSGSSIPEKELSTTLTYQGAVYNFTNNEKNDKSYTRQINKFISKFMKEIRSTVINYVGVDGLYLYTSTKLNNDKFELVSTATNFKPLTTQELITMKEILIRVPDEEINERKIELLTPEKVGLTAEDMDPNKDKYFIDGETVNRIDEHGNLTVNVWSFMYVNGNLTEREYHDGNVTNMISMMKRVAFKNKDAEFYFHNLKFDASYLVVGLSKNSYKPNYNVPPAELETGEYQVFATSAGWYTIAINFGIGKVTMVRDTLKLMTMSVAQIAKTINAPQGKSIIDYNRPRPEGYKSNEAEITYGMQDVIIPALGYTILVTQQGLLKGTSAGSAIEEVKSMDDDFNDRFVNQLTTEDEKQLQKTYRGGFVYVNPAKRNKDVSTVHVYDANSAYPSAMRNAKLPYGEVKTYNKFIPSDNNHFAWYKVVLKGKMKKGYLPPIQLDSTDDGFLEDNPNFEEKHPKHNPRHYVEEFKNDVVWLTEVDLELIKLNFGEKAIKKTLETKIGKAKTGLFRDFVDKHMARKIQASIDGNAGARFSAKLFLNSSYGKFGVKALSEQIQVSVKNDMILMTHVASIQDTYHVGVASAITAYVRNSTIRFALALGDKYLYSDTDSCHATGVVDNKRAKTFGVKLDPNELGAWKDETDSGHGEIKIGKVLGPKLYRYEFSDGYTKTAGAGITSQMWSQINHDNFTYGLTIPGKLSSKQIKGGLALIDTTFTIANETAKTPKSELQKQL